MVSVNVNGQERAFDGDPSMPLMWYLRDELGLTERNSVGGVALCGACTVHLNGEAIRSCSIPMSDVAGRKSSPSKVSIPKARILSRPPGAI